MNRMKYVVFVMASLAVLSLPILTANSADARIFPLPFTHPEIDAIGLVRTTDQQQRTVGDCNQYCYTEYLTTVEVIERYYGNLTSTMLVRSADLPYSDAHVPRPDRIVLMGLTLYDGVYYTRFDVSGIAGINNLAERIQNRFGATVDADPENSVVTVGYKVLANLWLDQMVSDAEFASFGGSHKTYMAADGDTLVSDVPEHFENITQWWVDSRITDEVYIRAVNYMADKDIIPTHFSWAIPINLAEQLSE